MADLDELMGEMEGQEGEQRGGGGGGEQLTPEELAEMLFKALAQGNEAMLKALARQAVRRYAGMEPGRPVGGTYYLYRTLRNLDLDGVLDRLMQQARDEASQALTPLEERLERDEYEARIDQLRKEIEAEIRRRLVADRGVEAMARTLRKPLPEDVDFMHASREEMASLRKAIYPLTRKLRLSAKTEISSRLSAVRLWSTTPRRRSRTCGSRTSPKSRIAPHMDLMSGRRNSAGLAMPNTARIADVSPTMSSKL